MAITRAAFPLPDVGEPLTAPFFAAAARDELAIRAAERAPSSSGTRRTRARAAAGRSSGKPVSGAATLFTWAVVRRAFLPRSPTACRS